MSTSASTVLSRYSEWLDPRFRLLLLFQMAFGYAYSALVLVPKFATVSLGASPQEVGILAGCPVLVGVLAAPFCGRWLDRGGHRAAMITGAALLVLSVSPFGYLQSAGPWIYAFRVVQGIGMTLVGGGSATVVARIVPAAHLGRAFGTAGAAALMMNAVSSAATEHLADAFGWGVAYQAAGAACAFALGLALVQPTGDARQEAAPVSTSGRRQAARRAGDFGTLAAGAGFGMLVTFTQPYVLSLGATHVASLFIGYTLTALLVRFGLGSLGDRWGRRAIARVALSIYAVTVLGASMLRPELLFVLGLCFGVAHGLAWPALISLSVETAERDRVGTALSRTQALFGGGTLLAVWLGGQLVGAVGYASAFLAAGVCVAGGAVALSRGTPRTPRVA